VWQFSNAQERSEKEAIEHVLAVQPIVGKGVGEAIPGGRLTANGVRERIARRCNVDSGAPRQRSS
jgi:hypothetical protein